MNTNLRPGMLINMRRRMWRVEGVEGGILTATPIDDLGAPRQRFLASIERPEPAVIEPPSLESFGDSTLHTMFLRAIRLDALHGTAPFLSLQRISVVPDEYQLVPLLMALRQQPVRLLIADTIGTGKTIEAGVIIKELLARNQARSVLIVVPAVLREQWHQQMRDLFYLDFEIISSDTRKKLERSIPPGADPWSYFDRLIVSIDYAKADHVRQDVLKREWDIVVVDEAHNAARPHSDTGRRSDMERWEFVRRLADRAKHLLLLTATPHNGYTDSFCSLLEMLSEYLVIDSDSNVRPNKERGMLHVCQRTRDNIQDWFKEQGKRYPFPQRESQEETEVPVRLDRKYMELLYRLDEVLECVEKHVQLSRMLQPIQWLRLHLHRRALSSPEALKISLRNRIERLQAEETEDQQQLVEQEAELALSSLTDRVTGDADTEDETDRRTDAVALHIDRELQLKYFGDILKDLEKFSPSDDRKLAKLRDEVIPSLLAKADRQTPARVIVFTRYKDTLEYLRRSLSEHRGRDYEVFVLHGDMSEAMREDQFGRFAQSERAVLLATDVISEGLNLQAASCMIVNYDIPWNPNRIEQRIGRVDRFGQRAPVVYVRTLYCQGTQDDDVIELFVRKFERIRRDLGTTPPLFTSEETLKRLIRRRRARRGKSAVQEGPTLFDELEDEDLFINQAVGRIKQDGFYGHTSIRLSEVTERLEQAHARFGSPDRIRHFIIEGLRSCGCSVEQRGDGLYRVRVTNPRLKVPGLPDELDQVVLDPALTQFYPQAEVLDVGHPLVRRLTAVIRERAMSSRECARVSGWYAEGLDRTLLLGHGLLRAVARTRPQTLLEEVVTFGVSSGLKGISVLTLDEARDYFEREKSDRSVDRKEALERVKRLYDSPEWKQSEQKAVEDTVEALRDYRRKIKEELVASGEFRSDESWLDGFDDIELIGFDLYCLTLLLPEAR